MFNLKNDHQHEMQCHPKNILPSAPPPPRKKTQQKPRVPASTPFKPQIYSATDALMPDLGNSLEFIPQSVFDFMTLRRKEIQLHVYTSVVENQSDFLQRLFKGEDEEKVNIWVREGIQTISQQVLEHVCKDIIEDDEYQVKRKKKITKQEIMNGRTPESIIKIREKMLREKISELQVDLHESPTQNQNSSLKIEPGLHNLFAPNSQKTKAAQQFITKMQKMQQGSRKEKERREQVKIQKQSKYKEEKKQIEERLKQEKHEFLKKQYEQKRKEKIEYFKNQEKKKEEFKQYLKQHNKKKPLFKKKQQEFFKNFVAQEHQKKVAILQKIKNQRRSITNSELTQHEKQYLQIKEQNEYEKNAGRMMQLKQRKKMPSYFKSRHHSMVQKQFLSEPENHLEKKTEMYNRRWEYSTEIKTKFAPKVSIEKKKQISQILEDEKWVQENKKKASIQGAKIDGMKNLEQVHRFVAELRAKGKLRDPETSRTNAHTPSAPRPKFKNYLHELNGQKEGARRSLNLSHIEKRQPQYVTMQAKRIQQNALRREQYLNSLSGVSIEKYLTEKKKLDDDFLESAKAKISLINRYE